MPSVSGSIQVTPSPSLLEKGLLWRRPRVRQGIPVELTARAWSGEAGSPPVRRSWTGREGA